MQTNCGTIELYHLTDTDIFDLLKETLGVRPEELIADGNSTNVETHVGRLALFLVKISPIRGAAVRLDYELLGELGKASLSNFLEDASSLNRKMGRQKYRAKQRAEPAGGSSKPPKPKPRKGGGTLDEWFSWYERCHDNGYAVTLKEVAHESGWTHGHVKALHAHYARNHT